MKIEKIIVGLYEENCYFVIKNKNCIIVDPGDESDKIFSKIEKFNLNVVAVLITHAHFDHIGALNNVLDKYNVPLYYHNINDEIDYDKIVNVKEDKYKISDFKFKVIYTPGHRNDSVTYYFYEEDIMFVGDFLFKDTIGRFDLEYASYTEMIDSIEKIKKYPDDITIYSGHGEKTNLEREKQNNPYFCSMNL